MKTVLEKKWARLVIGGLRPKKRASQAMGRSRPEKIWASPAMARSRHGKIWANPTMARLGPGKIWASPAC